jgi:hypothetical protein
MVSYRLVVFDILNDLKQIYDDADLTPFKVFYWVLIHADRLKKQHMEKIDSGAFITPFILTVNVEPDNGRNYFTLPASIYDFDKDDGIDYITYTPAVDLSLPTFASVKFTRTTPSKSQRLYFREEETPSPANPYFYRQGNRIYLLGVEQINITEIEAALKLSFNPLDATIDLDDEFEFPSDLIPVLKRQLLDLGRFVLNIPKDAINDGAGFDAKAMPTQKLISVNEQPVANGNQSE